MADNISDSLKKACAGDLDAYQRCILEFSPRVHAIAYQMVGNSIDAQDIAQNVFLRLYRSLHRYNPQYVFTTWLYRLTINISIDFLRKNSRHRNISLEDTRSAHNLKAEAPPPDEAFEHNEFKGAIRKVSEKMTCQKVKKQLALFVSGDLTERETTELLSHIEHCNKCRVELAELKLSSAWVEKIAKTDLPEPLPQDFSLEIIHKLEKESKIPRRHFRQNLSLYQLRPVSFIVDFCGQGRNLSAYRRYPWLYHRKKRLLSYIGSWENVYILTLVMPGSTEQERRKIERALIKSFDPYFNKGV